jgi:hypothetical protein
VTSGLDKLRQQQATRKQAPADGRPTIHLSGEPSDLLEQAIGALVDANEPPTVFVRGGRLHRFVRDENARGRLEPMSDAATRVALERSARFLKGGGGGSESEPRSVPAPGHLIESVAAVGEWPDLPAVEAVVEAPVLRSDGTVLDEPGYDEATRLYYDPDPALRLPVIPEQPSGEDVTAALALLRDELLVDFPFASDADRANALALLLTPIVRQRVSLAPLCVIDAPRAGSGKGLLTSITALIATGRPAPVMAAPSDEAEWGKSLTALLDMGCTLIFIDEAATLRSAKLGAALTASDHQDRRLGKTEIIRVPQRATWIAAGNNVQLGGDLPRRSYRVRIDAQVARPWTRSGFRHPNLERWTAQHRGELLAALLTLARAWHVAGRPKAPDLPALGSFEAWAATVGGILRHAGVEGFLGNLAELYDQNDEEARSWEVFLRAVGDVFDDGAFSTADLAREIGQVETLADALPEDLAAAQERKSFSQVLGKALKRRVDTRYGDAGLRIIRGAQGTDNTARWCIAVDLNHRESGSAGSVSCSVRACARPRARSRYEPYHSRHSRTPGVPDAASEPPSELDTEDAERAERLAERYPEAAS